MKKAWVKFSALFSAAVLLLISLTSCSEYKRDKGDNWKTKFDTANPDLAGAGTAQSTANADGWYLTFSEEFEGDTMPELFAASPNGLRKTEFWCDQMVQFLDGNAVITAAHDDNHQCDVCKETSGDFTSGIETRKMVDGQSVPLFEQAFGYFEARVKFPASGGMWSAFWLQSDNIGNIGFKGEDGTEIDIYESSFYRTKQSNMGHALHYDGYGKAHRCGDTIRDTGINLYDGFHTFALKWTPKEYVFYVDGQVTWASDFGGVSKVPAFLRLTNEVRPGKTGPYGQKLGEFEGGEFLIDSVRVYQNVNYLDFIKSPSDFVKE